MERRQILSFSREILVLCVLALFAFSLFLYVKEVKDTAPVHVDLSFYSLPFYTLLSMTRGLLAYGVSLVVSLFLGVWTAKDRLVEKCIIPLLDVLESIPILGFMPGAVLLLIYLFPVGRLGLEIAAILLIFTSQVWNMIFGVYHAIRTVPKEEGECASVYRLSAFQRFRLVELPYASISLIWNSMMSMAGGWFFLMVSESFRLGDRDFSLPGIGSYMSVAASQGNTVAMMAAAGSMVLLILFLDQVLWRPLLVSSQAFRGEAEKGNGKESSWFLQVWRNSFLVKMGRAILKQVGRYVRGCIPRRVREEKQKKSASRPLLFLLLFLVFLACLHLFSQVVGLSFETWRHLAFLFCLTFFRVVLCLCLGTLIALALGLWIGLSQKRSARLEPLLQVVAAFPATLLFPVLVLLLQRFFVPLGVGSVLLLLTGSLWYIVFNVLAGVQAIPSDLKEAAQVFRLQGARRFFRLYLPVLFPYLVTGLLSASGGAWNASIVAEYVLYQSKSLVIPGIGSSISLAAEQGDFPLLIASILFMAILVALINYHVWLRLYHYSEKRFTLTT